MSIKKTLNNRGKTHGDFNEQFKLAQEIKEAMRNSTNWEELPPVMKEVLEMHATKISRILTGNYNHADNWHDIAGYSMLVDNSLTKE